MNASSRWPLTLYYDGDCPLCAREIALLRRHAEPGRLQLVDINDNAFLGGPLAAQAGPMRERLHARFADGQWVTGLDATLWSWRAAGLARWAAPLSWRPLRPLLELLYRLFCRLRPHLAGLPHPDAGKRCRLAEVDRASNGSGRAGCEAALGNPCTESSTTHNQREAKNSTGARNKAIQKPDEAKIATTGGQNTCT